MKKQNIFVDTNILIGAFLGNKTDENCLKFLFSLKDKVCFVSSLSIAQFAAFFQKHKLKKSQELKKIIEKFLSKYEIVSFTKSDIQNAFSLKGKDIEDNFQFQLCKKTKCFCIVTNNKKDFQMFEVPVLTPKNIKNIKFY